MVDRLEVWIDYKRSNQYTSSWFLTEILYRGTGRKQKPKKWQQAEWKKYWGAWEGLAVLIIQCYYRNCVLTGGTAPPPLQNTLVIVYSHWLPVLIGCRLDADFPTVNCQTGWCTYGQNDARFLWNQPITDIWPMCTRLNIAPAIHWSQSEMLCNLLWEKIISALFFFPVKICVFLFFSLNVNLAFNPS